MKHAPALVLMILLNLFGLQVALAGYEVKENLISDLRNPSGSIEKLYHLDIQDQYLSKIIAAPENSVRLKQYLNQFSKVDTPLPVHRSKGKLWVYFKVKNDLPQTYNAFFQFHQSHLHLEIYEIKGASVHLRRVIAKDHMINNDKRFRHPTYEHWFEPGEKVEFLVGIKTPYLLTHSVNFIPMDRIGAASSEMFVIFSYYGFMLALILYNLFLFLSTRISSYLLYVFFTSSICLSIAGSDGIFRKIFAGFEPVTYFYYTCYSLMFVKLFGLFFFEQLFPIRTKHPRVKFINRLIVGYLVAIALITMSGYPNALDILNLSNILFGIYIISMSFYFARSGAIHALVYLSGWIVLVLSAVVATVIPYVTDQSSQLQNYVIYFGSAFDILMASFALGLKINQSFEKKISFEAKAAEADKLQKLLRTLSHDISNPLNVVIAQASMTKAKKLTSEQHEKGWAKVIKATRSALDVLESVRNLEGLRSGKITPTIEDVSLIESVEHAKFIFAADLERKSIGIEYQVQNSVEKDIHFRANKQIFQNSILNNLVSNAIKFSLEHSTIVIGIEKQEQYAVITVQDQGVGILEEDLDRIFSENDKTTRKGTQGESGTGFGLPLVMAFVKSMSGEISVDSKHQSLHPEDHGTTFSLKFLVSQSVSANDG